MQRIRHCVSWGKGKEGQGGVEVMYKIPRKYQLHKTVSKLRKFIFSLPKRFHKHLTCTGNTTLDNGLCDKGWIPVSANAKEKGPGRSALALCARLTAGYLGRFPTCLVQTFRTDTVCVSHTSVSIRGGCTVITTQAALQQAAHTGFFGTLAS